MADRVRIAGRTVPKFAWAESELDLPFNSVQVSDVEQTRYWLESLSGHPVPLPPVELLEHEPVDSPAVFGVGRGS